MADEVLSVLKKGMVTVMPKIWLRNANIIAGALRTEQENGPFIFHCIDDSLNADVEVTIDASGAEIKSKAQVVVSEQLLQALEVDRIILNELPEALYSEIAGKLSALAMSSRRVLRLLQQEMQDPTFLQPEELLGGVPRANEWSLDNKDWRELRGGRGTVTISEHLVGQLDSRWQQRIQRLLDEREEPLVAMHHLLLAQRISGGRFKWIEATIAAELAIKEILVRMEPKLKTLLAEVPSPPLTKLYGEILESVSGERSPFRAELGKRMERRNRLVHRPGSTELNDQEAVNYVSTVDQAIKHLLELHRAMRSHAKNTGR
jgi:hypothetical protein